MRTIAIINQKGGVGKTTTTANLGAALARAGKNILLLDLDPQGHLTLHFGAEVGPEAPTVYDVLTAATPMGDVLLHPRERVAIAPADIDLAAAEAELVSITGREVLLREALTSLDGDYDAAIIDCPPSLGILTINALAAASEVVIPLQAHFFGLQGLSKLLDTVMLVRQRINPALTISGIALCMHEASTKLAGEVSEDLARFLESARGTDKPWSQARLYQTCIRRNIKLAESSSFGQTVFDYAPKSNGAADYANLATEIFPGLDFEKITAANLPAGQNAGEGAPPKQAVSAYSGVAGPSPASGAGTAVGGRSETGVRPARPAKPGMPKGDAMKQAEASHVPVPVDAPPAEVKHLAEV